MGVLEIITIIEKVFVVIVFAQVYVLCVSRVQANTAAERC